MYHVLSLSQQRLKQVVNEVYSACFNRERQLEEYSLYYTVIICDESIDEGSSHVQITFQDGGTLSEDVIEFTTKTFEYLESDINQILQKHFKGITFTSENRGSSYWKSAINADTYISMVVSYYNSIHLVLINI